ncbi:MAG: hypothetical protein DRP09_19095 [Candidatus Thorarchaeota archaeon]|nr:MAG: hypothetical protein DRP09_19095 [Candidatus Thorarchaeota archaeon]
MKKKVTSPSEYRKKSPRSKIVETPSGAVFKIREIDIVTFGELQKLYAKMPAGQVNAQSVVEYLPELARILLPAGVEEPKIVADEPSEDALSIDEIRVGDQIDLIFEIMDFSGISELAEKLPKSFRRRAIRKARS